MKKNIFSLLICLTIIIFSCKRDNSKFEGPDLNDLYGTFSVSEPFSANRDSVNFAANELVVFSASFTTMIDWKISIKGLNSGAVKIITGKSKLIDAGNSLWNGSTTEFPLFKAEKCAVELTFLTEPDTLRDTIKILQPKLNQGFKIADFETGMVTGWTTFIQSGANMNFGVATTSPVPQGNKFYNMAGTVNWDWLIGLIEFPASAYGAPRFPLNTNAQNVYFNVLVWGEPGLTNALLLFQFREDDNGNGIFESASEDEYDYQLSINWTGWKLISVKYSDLVTLVNGAPASPKGNQLHNPDKLMKISTLHLANPASGFSKTKMDYILFTENAALEP